MDTLMELTKGLSQNKLLEFPLLFSHLMALALLGLQHKHALWYPYWILFDIVYLCFSWGFLSEA